MEGEKEERKTFNACEKERGRVAGALKAGGGVVMEACGGQGEGAV